MRAAIHCRRSTDQQGASLDDQEAEGRAYCEARSLTVVHTYRESASGYKPGTPRPDFDHMMRDAEAGKFSVLVVWRLNRLSRQEGDDSALAVVWRLRKLGVQVHSIREPGSGNDLADDLLRFVASYQGNAESRTKSADVQRGKRRGAQRGVHQGAWACFGFDAGVRRPSPVGNRLIKFYAEDPDDGPVVREILRRYVAGQSPQQIAHWLNERGTPPPRPSQYHPLKRRGGPEWHQSSIRDLIANPLLAGFVDYHGHRVKACPCATLDDPKDWTECAHDWVRSINVPAIVPEELWNEAQQVMRLRRSGKSGPGNLTGRGTSPDTAARFLLSGLVWCDRCGERIGCRSAKSARNKDKYRCRGRRMGKCDMPPIDQATLDAAVLDHLRDRHMDVVDVRRTVEKERDRLLDLRSGEAALVRDELTQVEEELATATRQQRKVQQEYEAGDLTARLYSRLDDDYEARRLHAEKAQRRLRDRLSSVEGSVPVEQLDVLLDDVSRVQRLVQGTLDADTTPMLQDRLRMLFEEFRVSVSGTDRQRIIVEPRLRPEHRPEGTWRTLDFADPAEQGTSVEVVDYLGVELTKIDLLPNPVDS